MPKFLMDINLDQNELLNGVLHKSTSATRPATPVVGQVTFDTDDFKIYTWNGTAWNTPSSGTVTSVTGSGAIHTSGTTSVTVSVDSAAAATLGVIQLAGDLTGGTAVAPVVSGVGYGTSDATTAAAIHAATLASHTQNTDTGTTSATFQIGSSASGPKLKNVNGVLYIRNAADGVMADLRVNNLTVDGTMTTIHSQQVLISDNVIELNSDLMSSANNSDGGILVSRLLADASKTGTISGSGNTITGVGTAFTTEFSVGDTIIFGAQRARVSAIASNTSLTLDGDPFSPQPSADTYSGAAQANAEIYFDNTNGVWSVVNGATTALQTHQLARKFAVPVGDGIAKVYVVTHNMNTRDVSVTVRTTASTYDIVIPDVACTSLNTVTVTFKKVVTSNQYQVTVIG